MTPGNLAPGPCALPIAAGRIAPAPVGALATRRIGSCTPPLPVLRRPWALGLSGAAKPSGELVLAEAPVADAAPHEGRRVAETVFSATVGLLAVLATLGLVSMLLPGATVVGGVATGFLPLAGVFAGYAARRWVRWVPERAERLHWSVIAAVGAAATTSELYGAAAIAVARSGFVERLTALAGFGFATALTVAVTGAASLVTYHRSVTDAQLRHRALRFS